MKPHLFFGVAVALFVVALTLALTQEPWRVSTIANQTTMSPNVLAGLAALGFAVAGGLALVAAALASWHRAGQHDAPPPREPGSTHIRE